MNYVVIRTRLQAIIAAELVKNGEITRPFSLVQVYMTEYGEDDEGVYTAYRELANDAERVHEQAKRGGFFRLFSNFVKWLFWSKVSGGAFYVANINWHHLALAVMVVPWAAIRTFDDGSANVQNRPNSFQWETRRRQGRQSLGYRILLKVFPKGAPYYLRKKIDRHYTVYPGLKNIVPVHKLYTVNLDWTKFLSVENKHALLGAAGSIFLGTVSPSRGDESILAVSNAIVEKVDLFIPHPRDWILRNHARALPFSAPAESIIEFYARKGGVTVLHFNSSAVLPFHADSRCKLVDLSGLRVEDVEFHLSG